MSIEGTPASATIEVPPVSDHAIKAETERLLRVAAERNNLPYETVKENYQAVAAEQAAKNLEEEAKRGTSYKALYEAERKKREEAENVLQSIREQGQKHNAPVGDKPEVVYQRALAKAGEFEWNHRLTLNQKLTAVGIPPESVNVKEAAKVFGRGADSKLGSDLHKGDPQRYRTLKLAAMVAGVYGR